MNVRVTAIIPSAGCGSRLGLKTKKPFVGLNGKPLIVHTLQVFQKSVFIDSIYLAADKKSVRRMRDLVTEHGFDKVIKIVVGGDSRLESVANCVRCLPDDGQYLVMVHDAARPFVNDDIIERVVSAAARYGAAIAAVRESDTVKSSGRNLFVKETLNRELLYRVQTPQAFKADIIKRAYDAHNKGFAEITDDSRLVERLGIKVKIVEGAYSNIKITTKDDLRFAEYILKSQ